MHKPQEKPVVSNRIYAQHAQMDRLSDMVVFKEVVEAGGFSAAARQMGAAPSSISRTISRLESELGTRLFHRTTRKQSLTESGELYFQHAQRIVAEIEAARIAVSQLSQTPAGTLQISVEPDLANELIAPILPLFLKRYPKVQVSLSMSASLADLVDERIDLAIRMGHLDASSLVARKIADSRSRLYASSGYLEARGIPAHPRDLSNHACLSFRLGAERRVWEFETRTERFSVPVSGPTYANSLTFLRAMAVAGCGVAMLPTWSTRESVARGELVPLLEGYSLAPPSTPINVVFGARRQLAPKIRLFVDFLAEHTRLE